MKTFRSVIFWLHLVAGLVAGISIGLMCLTGTVLAFESEIVAWAERDARRVTPPAPDAARLPLADLLKKAKEARPEAPIASLVVSADPRDAVTFPLGREGALYANPYTGEIRAPASTRTRDFMRLMTDWHRYLALSGDKRPIGKAINGACNLAFFFLALSGPYLWLPRSWSWRSVKAVALFNWRLTGKARDFNWHNVIGLWCAPVLIVLTLTAVPLAYRWGGNLIYQLAGEEPPSAQNPGPRRPNPPTVSPPSPGATLLTSDALLAAVQSRSPDWETINLQLGGSGPRAGLQAITVTVKAPGMWPRTASTTLNLDPYTGAELRRETFADLPASRRIRTWSRFLHTGQALGWGGQLVAGLACLGGCFLVYTGFALAWRRFFGAKQSQETAVG